MAGLNVVKNDSGFVDNWQSGKTLAECNLRMLMTGDSCDVSFRIGKEAVPARAHSFILISRSCVFHAMLNGPLGDTENIKIPDIEYEIFSDFLRYLYTDNIRLTHISVTGLLYAAKKYAVGGLEKLCLSFLERSLSVENACVVMEQAHLFDEKDLYERSLCVILSNGDECLETADFLNFCHDCMNAVISSDGLTANPEEVFKAAISWAKAECGRQEREVTFPNVREQLGNSLYKIPFTTMDQEFYVKEVLPLQILTPEENVKIMACLICQEQDPSPFKRRSFSPVTFDVIFYAQLKPVAWSRVHSVNTCRGRVDFSSLTDVRLVGVYLLSSPGQGSSTYNIRIQKPESGGYLENDVYKTAITTNLEGGKVIAVKLRRPVKIEKQSRHMVYVEVTGGISQYTGDGIKRKIEVGQCSFDKLPYESTYANCSNILYGLMIQKGNQTSTDV